MDDERIDQEDNGGAARRTGWGCAGMVAGFYVVGFIVDTYQWISTGDYDPSTGMGVGLIALILGCPLGFLLGAIFGNRKKRKRK
jgi:LPXTG-motif cell wall-anchored protein